MKGRTGSATRSPLAQATKFASRLTRSRRDLDVYRLGRLVAIVRTGYFARSVTVRGTPVPKPDARSVAVGPGFHNAQDTRAEAGDGAALECVLTRSQSVGSRVAEVLVGDARGRVKQWARTGET